MDILSKAQKRFSALIARGVICCFFIPAWGFGAANQASQQARPAAAAGLAPVGRLARDRRLHLAIGLPLRNEAELSDLLQQLYDPANPNYRHWWTPEQLAERFG